MSVFSPNLKVFTYHSFVLFLSAPTVLSISSWRKSQLGMDIPLSSQSAAIKVSELGSALDTEREVAISYIACPLNSPLREETCFLHLEL